MKANVQPTQAEKDIASGQAAVRQEIKGLEALLGMMEGSFAKAVEIIATTKGRVIISGMGKSGHIARKIAATFASTGTPAHFIHPGEASHGDLGMIAQGDCVLLLSNSGETPELKDIIAYTRRFAIPLIGIVRRKTSQLVDSADLALVLPEVAEANSIGAPTTSTTMMLALGDALAVALVERRGFGTEEFRLFHPGGKLGSNLLKVSELMHVEMPLAKESAPMSDVIVTMSAGRFGCAGVVSDSGKLAGIVTDGDLRRAMSPELLTKSAKEVMTKDPKIIRSSALAAEALALMQERAITVLFVVEDGAPRGILHMHDLLKAGVI